VTEEHRPVKIGTGMPAVDGLETARAKWRQRTKWGGPGVRWSVDISGLVIPATNEEDARRLATTNANAVLLMQHHGAWHEVPAPKGATGE
jgi:hypothetical protein